VTVSLRGSESLERDWVYKDFRPDQSPRGDEGPTFRARYVFSLPPGKYQATVRVEEVRSGAVGEAKVEFQVRDQGSAAVALSDPVFGRCDEAESKVAEDVREGLLLPHPSRRYGDSAPSPCVLVRVLDRVPDAPDSVYDVSYRISGERGTRVEGTSRAARSGGQGELILPFELGGLGLGEYVLRLEFELGGERGRCEASFSVDESRVSVTADSRRLRVVLGYVATNRELVALDGTPDEKLPDFWEDFWARRDAAPETEENEAMAEFMRRVEYATRHFGDLEPGWDSDRGRIYILYGAPDRIEETQTGSRFPTRIWYYYERNATFVFQDVEGLGRYRLVGNRRR
jgi:GWxTD domain-containing protein